jgi:hypothetical protein
MQITTPMVYEEFGGERIQQQQMHLQNSYFRFPIQINKLSECSKETSQNNDAYIFQINATHSMAVVVNAP